VIPRPFDVVASSPAGPSAQSYTFHVFEHTALTSPSLSTSASRQPSLAELDCTNGPPIPASVQPTPGMKRHAFRRAVVESIMTRSSKPSPVTSATLTALRVGPDTADVIASVS